MAEKLPKALRLELMQRAWSMATEGIPQLKIADELGIHQSQVSRYLARVAARTWDRLADEARTYAVLNLAHSHYCLHEARKAFERSCKPKRKATKRTTPLGLILPDGTTKAGTSDATTTEVIEREGDPAWLGEIRAAIRLRHELLPPPSNASDDDDDGPGADSVAGALIEAEKRNAAYAIDTTEPPDEPSTPDSTPDESIPS